MLGTCLSSPHQTGRPTIENGLTVAQRDTNASITLLTSVTGRITKLYFEKIEGLLVSHPFMTIGTAYRAAFHFLMTTQALAMIGTFEPYTRFSLRAFILINDYGLMALSTSGG